MPYLLATLLLILSGSALALGRGEVMMERLTSAEIGKLIEQGTTTAIVVTGGIEQNGPYLATGKHNLIARAAGEAVARQLGKALVAPVLPVVINGEFEPVSGHMRYPGTLSLRSETFINVVIDLVVSLRVQGFREIILLGDSGSTQKALQGVAKALNEGWADSGVVVRYIPDYYQAWHGREGPGTLLRDGRIQQVEDGHHHDVVMASVMLSIDPHSVRVPAVVNGVRLEPVSRFQMLGRFMLQGVVSRTVTAVRAAR